MNRYGSAAQRPVRSLFPNPSTTQPKLARRANGSASDNERAEGIISWIVAKLLYRELAGLAGIVAERELAVIVR